jgi:hypothetical protein
MDATEDVQYVVLPDELRPYLLARVRWPDVFQAISPGRPDWQDDPGLFDLPYDPGSTIVTRERAAALAADWGAQLPDDESSDTSASVIMRRMPADWSNLSPAEKSAWSIMPAKVKRSRRRFAAFRRRPRHVVDPLPAPTRLLADDLIVELRTRVADADVDVDIDLTTGAHKELAEVDEL